MDIGNQYIVNGPTYDPSVLAGLSQKDIAGQLSSADSASSRKILATANYITAGVCAITNNQPTNVCSDPTIQQIEQAMPKATANSGSSQLASINGQSDLIAPTRRKA